MARPVDRASKPDAAVSALSLDRSAAATLQTQLAGQLRRMILSGRIAPAGKLPSSRALAQELGVSRSTVVSAFDQLASEGYVESRRGSRLYVSPALPEHVLEMQQPPTQAAGRSRPRLDPPLPVPAKPFQPGAADGSLFPHADWARLLHRVWRKPQAELLAPADPSGWLPLRRAISQHLRAWRGIECHEEQIVITAGVVDAADLISRCVFAPGDAIYMEDPGFPPLWRALSGAGLELAPIPVDEEGFNPGLARTVRRQARGVFVTPSRQFPLGPTLPLARRLELLDWAATANSFIIEDDFDSEHRYEGAPLPALMSLDRKGRVIYMGSFSKVVSSSLRLGFLVAPEWMVAAFHERLRLRGPLASLVCQPVLAEFMLSGAYATHIRRTRRIYRRRRDALLAAAERRQGALTISPASSGMHVIARLTPEFSKRMTDVEASSRAEQAGVIAVPLSSFYAGPPQQSALLLGFAGFPEESHADAFDRLCAALI
jgi:GntR family transcriptional regulator/MocR family aminotransferase